MGIVQDVEKELAKSLLDLAGRVILDVIEGKSAKAVLSDVEFWLAEKQAEALERAKYGG